MHIRISEARRGTTYEILCDVCGQAIDLDEDCDYLTMRGPVRGEAKACTPLMRPHPGPLHKSLGQIIKPRHIIQHIADQNRNPVITDFLRQLKQDQKERLNRS